VAIALAVALAPSAALAQVPGFPSFFPDPAKPAPQASTPAAAETPAQTIERLRSQIAEVNADRARAVEPPPGIPPQEVAALEDARTSLVTTNEVRIRALGELAKAKAEREAAETQARSWQGFDEKLPFSILRVDELRTAADSARTRLAAVEQAGAHLNTESERYLAETRRAEENLRRQQEAVDRATDATERAQATWRRDLAQLRLRAVASRAATVQAMRQIQSEELAARQAEVELATRKVGIAAPGATFSEADLAKAKERFATIQTNLRAEQRVVLSRIAARQKERDEAQAALQRLRERPDAPADELAVAQARLQAAETWLTAITGERELLENLATIADEQGRMWEARRTAYVAEDGDERRAATERLRSAASRLTRWRGFLDNLAGLQRASLAEAEASASRADTSPGTLRYLQEHVAALRKHLSSIERGQDAIGSSIRSLDRWVADIDAEQGTRSLRARLSDNWSALKGWARDLWNFELFEVEDTAMVDGREVKTSRGVTVGKSIGAFLVFVLGYWLAAVLARRVERGLVHRGFDARRVRNYRRWVLILVAALLALFTLNIARIPLTVFAFFGGALAIGVGFGTQTIIRNFISGVILLAERRIQIGDIIEVDGVTGTVTAVDLRSSTVLGFDGVETSVPNASLLESRVTNWTQTDKRVRRAVKVGVAYGSSLREVADILEECAKRHGVVLNDPPPLVIFEDFGNDALMFALYFWVELRPTTSAMQVASDLRFMIAKRLDEAGIVIAFPQRDVHLDAATPLRVELTNAVPPVRAAGGTR
jgi:small-conductance mechanosensitive channel